MASWYRKFIKDFATIADPLTKLTRKDAKFAWKEEHECAFNIIKNILSEAPLLHRPDPNEEYILHCDASNTGLGSVITQTINGEEKVIAYASRALRKNEINYSTTERECLAIKFAIEKFRPYIEGDTFTVITDHSALQWLFKKKDPVGRLGRWAQELTSYNFKIVHRKGKHNVVPDALSRMFEDDESIKINTIRINDITSDKWYKKRIYQITKHPYRYRDWKVVNGNIYKYRPDEDINDIITDLDAWKLVVPKEKRETTLQESHTEATAAHPGIEKTYKRLAQFYYWPGVYNDTANFVKNCKVCQQTKTIQRAQIGLMGTREVDRPWKILAADLIGEFPRSKAGYRHVIVFEDLFSRFIICVPIRKKTAENVKDALENTICAQYGAPEIFLSDNGREFINDVIKQFLEENSIIHERTPAYHPQSNPVERVNRDLKTRIAAYIEDNHKEWDRYIPQFQFAHNTNIHAATGKSPAFLMFGRTLHPPKLWKREIESQKIAKESNENKINTSDITHEIIDTDSDESIHNYNTRNHANKIREKQKKAKNRSSNKSENKSKSNDGNNLEFSNTSTQKSVEEWTERMHKLRHIRDNAQIQINKEKQKQAKYYNRNKREDTFQIGQLVWKKNHILSSAQKEISAKLAKPYIGPYKINNKIGENIYILEDADGNTLQSSCHAKELKSYTERADISDDTADAGEVEKPERNKPPHDSPHQRAANLRHGKQAEAARTKRRPGRPRKQQISAD